MSGSNSRPNVVVVVVVFFTLTDRASTIPGNIRGCQSGTWSQRGTKVNGSHHGDNPLLLGPTGIQIATKSYATLQAMAPTNNKTVHRTSFTPYREQPRSTRIVVAYPRPAFSATKSDKYVPTSFDQQYSKFLKATHRTKIRKLKYRGPWWWRPWAGVAGARASIQPSKAMCILEKAPRILPVRRSMWPS